jgi:hypothetical protein
MVVNIEMVLHVYRVPLVDFPIFHHRPQPTVSRVHLVRLLMSWHQLHVPYVILVDLVTSLVVHRVRHAL